MSLLTSLLDPGATPGQGLSTADSPAFAGLTINGVTTLSGNATVKANLLVEGTTTLSGAATLNTTLTVSGAAVFLTTFHVDGQTTLSGNAVAKGTLLVEGATTLSGAATLNTTLTVSGAAVFLTTMHVDGTTTLSGAAVVNGTLTTNSYQLTTANVGTVGSGSTVVERGSAHHHTSVITVNTTLPAIAGGAALAVGKLLYTFPAGVVVVDNIYMTIAITQTQGNINANTPDVGLGTTIGSGANALLSSVGAAAENILTGQTAANCTGTATVKVDDASLGVAAADSHTVYLNAAATWSASGDAAALLTGTVVIDWVFLA